MYYGIVDGNLDWHRSRLVQIDASVSGRQTDMEPFGIDREGDGRPDLSWDHFVCDEQGNPSQTATANKVVRVERGGGAGTPRFCSVSVNNDKLAAYCFGPSVNVGEKIVAVSADHHHLVLDRRQRGAVPGGPARRRRCGT